MVSCEESQRYFLELPPQCFKVLFLQEGKLNLPLQNLRYYQRGGLQKLQKCGLQKMKCQNQSKNLKESEEVSLEVDPE